MSNIEKEITSLKLLKRETHSAKREPNKRLYQITAYSPCADVWVDLEYESIDEAQRRNPRLTNFRIVGIAK